jgi:hypothetical protein
MGKHPKSGFSRITTEASEASEASEPQLEVTSIVEGAIDVWVTPDKLSSSDNSSSEIMVTSGGEAAEVGAPLKDSPKRA